MYLFGLYANLLRVRRLIKYKFIILIMKQSLGPEMYRVIKSIGHGEHGTIFLVEFEAHGKREVAAMKKLTHHSRSTNDAEFRLLPQLHHPNIIHLLNPMHESESIKEEDSVLMMEYAANGDLQNYTKKVYDGTLVPENVIVKWLCQLCLALQYLHSQVRILHRDIKMKNILVMGNGLLKLGDFGTAKQLLKHQDFAMTSVGTPYYLSPQAVGLSKYSSKSDVWGLGCVMFELCTGRKPFLGTTLNDLIKQIMNSQVDEISKHYSQWLRILIKSMFQKNLEKRPTIQAILQRRELKLAFMELKQEYEKEYNDFKYPLVELKTKKYCEREEKLRVTFYNESLKTAKNERNLKVEVFQRKNEETIKNNAKDAKDTRKVEFSKFKDRSLKSIIEKRKISKQISNVEGGSKEQLE